MGIWQNGYDAVAQRILRAAHVSEKDIQDLTKLVEGKIE